MSLNSRAAMQASKMLVTVACAMGFATAAWADPVQSLRSFVKDVKSAQASFTQTVTSPDGKKARKSIGTLEFERPNRFRFAYTQPIEQLIVGDGQKVWLYDADLNQVTVRGMSQAVGASPAALLAGGNLDKDFTLKAAPAAGQIEWVEALPKAKDGQLQSVKVGFTAGQLVALELLDSFGQKSRLDFQKVDTKVTLSPSRFNFTPPPGADVLQQP